MRPRARKLLERRHDIERGGVTIGILALCQRPRLLALRAAGDEGDQLEQRVGRRRQRDVVDQHFAQRLAVDLGGVGGAEQRDDLIDEADLVACEHAKTIADDIVELALGEIELDVIGLFLRLPLVEQAPRQERRRDRIVARAAGLGDRHRHGRRRHRIHLVGRLGRRRLVQLLVQRLQHPRGFLAAGDAEIEPCFATARDRLRIVVAIVAALPAILLRHRGHHLAAHGTAFGELHPVRNRHGLVVPWRFTVVAVTGLHDGGTLLRRQRRGHIRRQQPGKEAVEPGALRVGERRAGGNDVEFRRGRDLVHADTCASASLRSVSPSWRRAKDRKVSSGDERWAI